MAREIWIIEPRDPFIARDGKPFGVGVSAATLPFPFPSTTTGGVRTRAGFASGSFVEPSGAPNKQLINEVKQIATGGVFLVELDEQGEIQNWFMPAPADALLLEAKSDKSKAQIKRLAPLDRGDGITNLDQRPHGNDKLVPVGLPEFDPSKPFEGAPRFWRWENFKEWLVNPDQQPLAVNPKYIGHDGTSIQTRTHVALDPSTWTSLEGQLFQTRGLEFTRCEQKQLNAAKRLALAVPVDHHTLTSQLTIGLSPLGGERRTVAWRKSKMQLPNDSLGEVKTRTATDYACRVVLLTPAWFDEGSRPNWLLEERHGIRPKLIGIANARAQVISGWDFEHYEVKTNGRVVRGQPKKTRRLMPAGSVFFLRLATVTANSRIEDWVEAIWMTCISDDAKEGDPNQHRHDGFGLAVIGTWDGKLRQVTFPTGSKG